MSRNIDLVTSANQVLRQGWFGNAAFEIVPLGGAGGYSGAEIFRITAPCSSIGAPGLNVAAQIPNTSVDSKVEPQMFCLRRWPRAHPDRERLRWIHRLMHDARQNGASFVPRIIPPRGRAVISQPQQQAPIFDTFVELNGYFWELAEWVSGEADFWKAPSIGKLIASMRALATFHNAVGFDSKARQTQTASQCASRQQSISPSPGVQARLDQAQGVSLVEFTRAIDSRWGVRLKKICLDFVALAKELHKPILNNLRSASQLQLPLQRVIRDVWHDHVFFDEQNNVLGLVDFGAANVDSVCGDICRLLGSMLDAPLMIRHKITELSTNEPHENGAIDSSLRKNDSLQFKIAQKISELEFGSLFSLSTPPITGERIVIAPPSSFDRAYDLPTELLADFQDSTQSNRHEVLGRAMHIALCEYQSIRKLNPNELGVIDVFDTSSILLSGVNWIRWLYTDGRQFEDMSQVAERVCSILGKMSALHSTNAWLESTNF